MCFAGHEILMDVDNNILLIVGNPQGIWDQQPSLQPINILNIITIVIMGKIQYVIVPNVAKRPRNISNPDGLSLPLKYLLAIKTNLSILILAYPKMVCSSNGHFYNWHYPYLWLSTHPHTHTLSLSLGLSAVLHNCPFFPFHINMTTVRVFDY